MMPPEVAENIRETPVAEQVAMFMSKRIRDRGDETCQLISSGDFDVDTLGWEATVFDANLNGHNTIKDTAESLNAIIQLVYPDAGQKEIPIEIFQLAHSLSCSLDLLGRVSATLEVRRFICDELPPSTATLILKRMDDLRRIAEASFPNLVNLSLELYEDPEWPEEKNIQITIHLKGKESDSYTHYRNYTRAFVEAFPFEFRKWFLTSLDYI